MGHGKKEPKLSICQRTSTLGSSQRLNMGLPVPRGSCRIWIFKLDEEVGLKDTFKQMFTKLEECLKIREALRNSSTESDIHGLLSLHGAPRFLTWVLNRPSRASAFCFLRWAVGLEESCIHRWDIIGALLGVKKYHPLWSCPMITRLYCLIVKVDIECLSFTLGKLSSQ